jgi:RNA polymerase sigma-E/F/G factor
MGTFTFAASHQSERSLLLAAQHADPGAQSELLGRYEPLVQATLRQLTLPARADRDDLAQEGRLALLRAIHAWSAERGAFAAFARRCIFNHLIQTLRSVGCRKRRALDGAVSIDTPRGPGEERFTLLERLPSAAPGPERCAIVSAQLRAVIDDLALLSACERGAVQGALNGRTQQELALEQHTTRKAVEQRAARARRKLASNPIFAAA